MFEGCSLSCRRGARLVFRDLSFQLAPGDFLQVTGANGSGKSTLLRALAGLLPLSGGTLSWSGQPVAKDMSAYQARLGYAGHMDALKPAFTVSEMIGYWQALWPDRPRAAEDFFGVEAFGDRPVRFLSAGQRRRLSLSRLLHGDALLWLLDEPASALDQDGQGMLARCIAVQRAKGGMVIAAVHHVIDAPGVRMFAMPGSV